MRFHAVHGANVSLEAQSRRAVRTASFCDAIAFSLKPVPVNSRVSIVLGASDEWSGALRLGVTSRDPVSLKGALPRYACPDLIAKQGFWARPLPEKWSTDGTRLTFYVSSQGHFQLFVNNEHKGALLSGLPVKEHLWLIFDLYGITLSIQFVSNSGYAPVEVLARGPEALAAYQRACADGCLSLHRTRLALVGLEGPAKRRLRRILLSLSDLEEADLPRRPVTSTWVCHSRPEEGAGCWSALPPPQPPSLENPTSNDDEPYDSDDLEDEECILEEEYYQAIARNIVREIMLQKRKKASSGKRTSGSLVRDALNFPSTLARRKGLYPARGKVTATSETNNRKATINDGRDQDFFNDDIPQDLPTRVQELVESMLAEAESKQDWDKLESEKGPGGTQKPRLTFHIWDFDAHPKYFLIHQAFFSPKTVYIFTVDLNYDLDSPLSLPETDWKGAELPEGSELNTAELFSAWLTAIHASVAQSNSNVDTEEGSEDSGEAGPSLRPFVVLVGVQTGDKIQAEETLCRLRSRITESPASGHVVIMMVHPESDGDMGTDLRTKLEDLSLQLPHVRMQVPLKWLAFERALDRLTDRGICMADLIQLSEVGRQCGVDDEETFFSVLAFFHHQGKVLYFESQSSAVYGGGSKWEAAVVLDPQWFIEQAYRVFALQDVAPSGKRGPGTVELGLEGVLSGLALDRWLGQEGRDERTVLLGILESLDLLCEIEPSEMFEASATEEEQAFLVPWSISCEAEDLEQGPPCSLALTVLFQGLLPVGLFTRLVCRVVRWSERHRWSREPQVFRRRCRVAVDRDYDVVLRLPLNKSTSIEVIILKAEGAALSITPSSDTGKECICPAQHVCAKVRLLLEQELEALRDLWFCRVSFQISVTCPCDRECKEHATPKCPIPSCAHYLPLTTCLASKVVMCDFRRVKTDFIRKYFPETSVCGIRSMAKRDSVVSSVERNKDNLLVAPSTPREGSGGGGIWDFLSGNWGAGTQVQVTKEDCGPAWMKSASKMLTTGGAGRDWTALARRLGYSEREINRFEEALYPSSSLLMHWMDVNAGTRYCLDLLLFCLEQMGREDVAESIRNQLEPEEPAPPVFLSYQWDSQAAALGLRRRLEMSGFPCWMDVGQMGAGDALYGKIYEGISRAKVVLLCLTPRYVVSPTSVREASLADVLRKPLLPVMLEPVPWPPPGPLAVVLSPIVYVALCGIGGHGGNGRQGDRECVFQEILNRVSQYAMPIPGFPGPMSPLSRAHIVPPTPSLEVIEEDFRRVDTPRVPAGEAGLNAVHDLQDPSVEGAGFDGDDLSSYSTTSSRGVRESPFVWRRSRERHAENNRITRCTVCALL